MAEDKKITYYLPASGKRKNRIKISFIFAEENKEQDVLIDKALLKIVMWK